MQASDGWYWKWLAKWRRKGEEIGVREMGELTQKEREVSCACVGSAIFKQLGEFTQKEREVSRACVVSVIFKQLGESTQKERVVSCAVRMRSKRHL